MAFNIAVPSTNGVPVMSSSYIMPPANAIIGGNLVVPPANPLLSSYVIPTTNIINGSVIVPTTNHVIGPASGIVMGGGFGPSPSAPALINPAISIPPGWNPIVDHSRKTAEVVEYLGRLYDGLLRCKKCQNHVAFDSNAIFAHSQQCFSSKGKSKPSDLMQKKTNSLIAIDPRSLSTIDEFKKFLQSYPAEMKNPIANSPPIDWMNLFLDEVDRTSFVINQFDCLSCSKRGSIVQWEEHVVQFHRDDPKISDTKLTCVCFVCNALLFGTQTLIQNHIHRLADASRSVQISNSIALYPNFKSSTGSSSRYHKFVLKTANPTSASDNSVTKMAFYCSACDFYGLKQLVKHFSSVEHKILSVVSDDLRQCEVCQIVLSSDALLMAVHRLTPSHLLRKSQDVPKVTDPWIETNVHQKLMESVQQRFSDHHFDSVTQRLAYCCDLCNFTALQVDDWRTHTSSEKHQEIVASNSAGQVAEFACVSCKLTLFGAFRAYLGHTTTRGHKLIKRAIVSRHNMQQLLQKQPQKRASSVPRPSKEAAKGSNVPKPPRLSEMLYVAFLGDDDDVQKERNTDAEVSAQHQQVKVVRGRKARCDSETGSASTLLNRQEQRASQVRSESESSTMAQRKSTSVVESDIRASRCGERVAGNVENDGESKPATKLRFSKPVIKSMQNSEDALQTTITNTNYSGSVRPCDAASPNVDQNLRPTRRSMSATPITNRGSGKSEDDESDCYYDCNSATSSSEQDAENRDIRDVDVGVVTSEDEGDGKEIVVKNGEEEVENDEDDENDLYDEILDSNETECNPMLSDEELDASVLKELKSDAASALNGAKVCGNTDENNTPVDEDRVIVRHLIVVRGIPEQVLQNKRIMYATFSRFGEIHRTYVKKNEPDSLYILVLKNPEAMFQKLQDNLVLLRTKLGSEEISVEHNTRSTNGPAIRIELSKEAQVLFSNRNKLDEAVLNLMQIYEIESKSAQSLQRIHNLEAAVAELAFSLYHRMVSTKVHIFGSRVTGLATDKSDVDIYLQLGESFNGCMHTNTTLQQQLVVAFTNKMKMAPKLFQNVISVPFARVPIVKFTDVCSGLNCDLSFKSGLSTMNSILVRTYLSLDMRVKYLVCAVKLWMKLNNFADRHLFTTYAQIWMVLFFLMQPEIAVVPTVLKLRRMLPSEQQQFNIEGWNCAFPNIKCILWRSACAFTNEELLTKFFEFYSNFNLKNYVLCTLTGIKTEKKHFLDFYDSLPPTFMQYRFKVKTDPDIRSKILFDFEGLCVQDPFDHSHNLTKTINSKKFLSLTEVCRETVDILKNN